MANPHYKLHFLPSSMLFNNFFILFNGFVPIIIKKKLLPRVYISYNILRGIWIFILFYSPTGY